jgi:hypothetical protein
MSGFATCCSPVGIGTETEVIHTIINVGGGDEVYVNGTGPNSFEMRTFTSSDSTVAISTVGDLNVDLKVDIDDLVSLENIGAGAKVWLETSGPDPFQLRSFRSPLGTVAVVQTATEIQLEVVAVPPIIPPEAWQEDTTTLIDTDSNVFVTFITMTGDAKVLNGETWQINMGVLICCPYATAGSGINAETQWQIEGPAGVFTQIDIYSVDEHISIVGSERSSPRFRMIKHVVLMDAPRMRIRVRRTVFGFTDFRWEFGRWGGNRISPAP